MNRRNFLKMIRVNAGGAAFVTDHYRVPLHYAAQSNSRDRIWHLLNRVTFGPRPGALEAVTRLGAEAYLEQQLQPSTIDDSFVESRLAGYNTLSMSVGDLLSAKTKGTEPVYELDSATILRAVYSQRQLQQVMVHFWSEHFSLWHSKGLCRFLITADYRDVIQANALGKFRDLLFASARSPAMLVYLDNYLSDKQHPNENYAREIMELHTLTSGHYTETDVQEVARCFTGWTVDLRPENSNHSGFLFSPELHDDGQKIVLGNVIPAGGGIQDVNTVLELLINHPATALHISTKLCRRFIQDDPPDSIVSAVQQTYLQTDGDIRAMLRTIFTSQEFWNAPPKFKRPFEFLISLFRALDADVQPFGGNDSNGKPSKAIGLAPLTVLRMMDHLPFNHETPEGYNDYGSAWESNLLDRWNVVLTTVAGLLPGVHVDLQKLVSSFQLDPGDPLHIVQYFGPYLFGRSLSTDELNIISQYLKRNHIAGVSGSNTASENSLIDTISLLTNAPAFMFR